MSITSVNLNQTSHLFTFKEIGKIVLIVLALLPALVLVAAFLILSLPLKLCCYFLGKQIHVLNALYRECFDVVALAMRYFSSPEDFSQGEGRPILFVHGYLHNATAWNDQITYLRERGFGRLYTVNLGDQTVGGKFWSIEAYAEQVKEKIQEITMQTRRQDIAIVAHSMGGLVSAHALFDPSIRTVTRVITLGSPFRGSSVADFLGIGPCGRQMQTDAPFVSHVQTGVTSLRHISFHYIGSRCDELVPAEYTHHHETEEHRFIFEDLGHASLLRSREVFEQVASYLQIDS